MGDGVPVIRQHEYLLELVAGTNLQLEDALLGPDCNILQMVYSISDCECRRVLVDAANFVAFPHYVLGQPVYCFYQLVLGDTVAIHKQNSRDDACRHDHCLLVEAMDDL